MVDNQKWLCYVVSMVLFLGLFFILFVLGFLGYWKSIWHVVLGIVLSGVVLHIGCRSVSMLVVKRLFAFLLICVLFAMPLFVVSATLHNQSTAQRLSSDDNINHFRNLLGPGWSYVELIVWGNEHLNFTYGDIERNTDPVKIFEYGKGRCEEFAILYAALCISQGYRCRIVHNVFDDHVFNEVLEANGTWIRVDSSLNDARAIGYPEFFEEEEGWVPPILSLALENSAITEVTGTYRRDGFMMSSPMSISILVGWFALSLAAIVRFLVLPRARQRSQVLANAPPLDQV